jgi:electron transfer flavoprotein beta subunit
MKILVFLRYVYRPATVRVSRSRGALDTSRAERYINPSDKCALEEALRLKDSASGQVTVMSLGCEEALREALAMGADEAVLIAVDGLEEPGEAAEAAVLAQAISKRKYNLVLLGHRVAGLGASQVGPRLAEMLKLPQITRAQGLEARKKLIRARSAREEGSVQLEAPLPAVITIEEEANSPRYATLPGVISAYREMDTTTLSLSDLGLDLQALKEGPTVTQVRETFAAPEREKGVRLEGDVSQAARTLVERLRSWGIL